MKLGELLDEVREYYLKRLRAALAEAGDKAIAEPAYRKADGSLAREGDLGLGLRGDLYTGEEMLTIDTQGMLSFDLPEFAWGKSLAVTLGPFQWNSLSVRLDGVGKRPEWRPLVDWFEKWFDGEDARKPGRDGLCGVVHFLSDPVPVGQSVKVSVDLGSAPVEAFEELLDAVAALGARSASIGGIKP